MSEKFEDLKEEVWGHFKDHQFVFLATSEEDQPRVRPVTLVCLDGKFGFSQVQIMRRPSRYGRIQR